MQKDRTIRTAAVSAVLASALLATACGNQVEDRAGGTAGGDVQVLTFAQPNHGTPEQLVAWAAEVDRLSQGALRIEFEEAWRMGEPDFEARTIEDVADGTVDMAWVGARALDRAGVTSFQALLAPLLVDSYALQADVFHAGIPSRMLSDLDGVGVLGIGVLPGPMRKVLGISKPFRTPQDFSGAVVGMQDSALVELTLRTLGAEPEAVPSGASLEGLDGYEQQLGSIWGNRYDANAGFVTGNLNLWPRPLVILAGDRVSSVSDEQRDILRQATAGALPAALDAARSEDEEAARELCAAGVQLQLASERDMADIQEVLRPVYEQLGADPATKRYLDEIMALKSRVGAAPETVTCAREETGPDTTSAEAFPEGNYEMTLTAEDALRLCRPGDPGYEPMAGVAEYGEVLFELRLENGLAEQWARRGGRDAPREPGWFGSYRVFRDRVELLEKDTETPLTATWSFEGGSLTLSGMRGVSCDHVTVWTTHPWIKVG